MVKVGFDGDDVWPDWAAWCTADRPHVLRVFSCHVFAHQGQRQGFVGIVERFERTDVAKGWMAANRLMKRDPVQLARLVESEHPGVAAMLRNAAAAFRGRCGTRRHRTGWRASGEIVLMDPLADSDEAESPAGR